MDSYKSLGLLSLIVLLGTVVLATPKPRDRVIKDPDLSDLEHGDDGDHNKEYDHEAFLGKEEAQKYDELTPEQSKERLEYVGFFVCVVFICVYLPIGSRKKAHMACLEMGLACAMLLFLA